MSNETFNIGDAVEFGSGKVGTIDSIRIKRIRGVQTKQIFVKCVDGSLHMAHPISIRKVCEKIADPYIFISSSGTPWFFYPAADEADESEINLETLPAEQADALLRHGFSVVVEGINDDDTLAAEVAR